MARLIATQPRRATLVSLGEKVQSTSTSYAGSTIRVVPPAGGTVTSRSTDARGQLVSLRQYQGPAATGSFDETTYTYSRAGQLASMTNPAGSRWTYTYDLRGLKTSSSDPDKGVSATSYDRLDRPVVATDANGDRLVTAYDDLGRKTSVSSRRDGDLDSTVRATWAYDSIDTGPTPISAKGLVVSSTRVVPAARDSGGADPLAGSYTTQLRGVEPSTGLPTSSATIIDIDDATAPPSATELNGTYASSMSYFDNGALKQVVQPSTDGFGVTNEVLNYTYDDVDNPRTMTGAGAIVADTVYTPLGQVAQRVLGPTIGHSIYDTYDYAEDTQRLTRQQATSQTDPSTAVYDARYGYDDAGNITALSDGADGFTQCFDYDYLQRLTQAHSNNTTTCTAHDPSPDLGVVDPYRDQYTYDTSGNRLSWTQTTGAGTDQVTNTHTSAYPAPTAARPHAVAALTTSGDDPGVTENFDYDGLGNTTGRDNGTREQAIVWDLQGHQGAVTTTAGTTETTTSYAYDADGVRLLAHDQATGTTTLFLGASQYAVTDNGSTPTHTLTRSYSTGDTPVAVRTTTGLQVLIADHHHTPQTAIDTTGEAPTVTSRRTTAFGIALDHTGSDSTETWPNDRGYLNKTADTTGTTHLDAREYDPQLGRFTSVDPILDPLDPQQANAYTYANNSPVTDSDPSGLFVSGGNWAEHPTRMPTQYKANSRNQVDSKAPSYVTGSGRPIRRTPREKFPRPRGNIKDAGGAIVSIFTGSVDLGWNASRGRLPFVSSHYNPAVTSWFQRKANINTNSWAYQGTDMATLLLSLGASGGTGIAGRSTVATRLPAAAAKTTTGWSRGGDIYALTKAGNKPAWSTVRGRFWKNEAANPQIDNWSSANLDRMNRGLAPQRYNRDKGGLESMDLSHEPIPYRDGGTNVVPRWPQDHAAIDPYRFPGY